LNVKNLAKAFVRLAASVAVLPAVASFHIRAAFLGCDRALEGSSQWLSLLPGLPGIYLRSAFYGFVLAECHPTARVEFGTLLSKVGARLGPYCYIGPHCHLGLAHIEQDVLIAAGVHIPSGGRLHETSEIGTPIREQAMNPAVVRIGAGSWIGAAAVVMADVGRDSIIGAGSVVTRPIPDRVVAAGVPARAIRNRDETERFPKDCCAARGEASISIHGRESL
jgi:acetyltransferase-like isoleucine patch superfamily enzyme